MEEVLDSHSLEVCKSRMDSPLSGLIMWDTASGPGDRPAHHQQIILIKLLGIHDIGLDSIYVLKDTLRDTAFTLKEVFN